MCHGILSNNHYVSHLLRDRARVFAAYAHGVQSRAAAFYGLSDGIAHRHSALGAAHRAGCTPLFGLAA